MNSVLYDNQLFLNKIDGNFDEREKVAALADSFIRDHLRESAFVRKIFSVVSITRADCQVSTHQDTLYKLESIEPNSRAMTSTFNGESGARVISGNRAEVGFYKVETEEYEKSEEELMAYTMPISKLIQDNGPADMGEVEDRNFLKLAEDAVQYMQKVANGGTYTALTRAKLNASPATVVESSIIKSKLALVPGGTDDFAPYEMQKSDIKNLIKIVQNKRLKVGSLLMCATDFTDISGWIVDDLGNSTDTILKDGYTQNTLLGAKVILTIKNHILRTGNIYAFAPEEFMGKFYQLTAPKMWLEKKKNIVSWMSWENIGMIIANVAAIAKLETYQASVTPTVETSGYAAKIPVEESEFGFENNKLAEGIKFPDVIAY